MIQKVGIAARMINFAAAAWVIVAVAWQAFAGDGRIEVPLLPVWLFLGAALVRFLLWVAVKAQRPS